MVLCNLFNLFEYTLSGKKYRIAISIDIYIMGFNWCIATPFKFCHIRRFSARPYIEYPDVIKSPCSALFRFIRLWYYILGIIYLSLYTFINLNFPFILALYPYSVLFPLFAFYCLIFLCLYYPLVINGIGRKITAIFPDHGDCISFTYGRCATAKSTQAAQNFVKITKNLSTF